MIWISKEGNYFANQFCIGLLPFVAPILIYHNEQKVLMLPEFWNAIDQWKALFGDVFHRDVTLSSIFSDSDTPTNGGVCDEMPPDTAPKKSCKWEKHICTAPRFYCLWSNRNVKRNTLFHGEIFRYFSITLPDQLGQSNHSIRINN